MTDKTQHGRRLEPGDRVVWRGRLEGLQPPDFRYTGTISQYLTASHAKDQVCVDWDGDAPTAAISWTIPAFLDHVHDVSAVDRLAQIKTA